MDLKILKDSKNEIEVEINSVTIAEILRVYLNKDSAVSLAVWRQEHVTKNPVLKVQAIGKTAKKAINDAVSAIEKDLDKILNDFDKLK